MVYNDAAQKKLKSYLTVKTVITAILVLVLVASQIERFVTHGTVLGYQLRAVKKTEISKNIFGDTQQPSEACKRADEKFVSGVLGAEVTRSGGIFGDRKAPTFISSCIYRTKQNPIRSTTLILRDAKDEAAAKVTAQTTSKNSSVEKVSGVGDEAYFSTTSLQLFVRDGKRITTVTVSKTVKGSSIESKDAALKIAKQLIKG